jgi:UDP-N-acetylmuramoylalanine--D-glutamate ligase
MVPWRPRWSGVTFRTAPARGVYFDGKNIVSSIPGRRATFKPPRHLPGRHNIENALAATALAQWAGASDAAITRAFDTFRGVEHRLEAVRERRGVKFVNDSKATNVDSTLVALEALPQGLHVILGGEHKGSPYAPLIPLLRKKARKIYLIGEAAPLIEKELGKVVPFSRSGDMARAVSEAAQNAAPGETVLLSPACASFDQFNNFEHRGAVFKELVGRL